MKRPALVVDDDPLSREFLVEALGTFGYVVRECASAEEAFAELKRGEPALVLTDLRLPGEDGLAVLRRSKELHPDVAVVVLTAFGSVETAVDAMRDGAEDFLLKPLALDRMEVVLKRLERGQRLAHENKVLRARLDPEPVGGPAIIGEHPRLLEVLRLVDRVATTGAAWTGVACAR